MIKFLTILTALLYHKLLLGIIPIMIVPWGNS